MSDLKIRTIRALDTRSAVALAEARVRFVNQQIDWALSEGLEFDDRGYVAAVDVNLYLPLSTRARRAFEAADGSELAPVGNRPAKMCALHSSSALVVNFFDYWSNRESRTLLEALGSDQATLPLEFEKKFPTGLGGKSPNLDVAFALASGRTLAIESKFGEWLTLKRPKSIPFKEKYFESDVGIWTRRGLPACQALATKIAHRTDWFWYLDAPQLLKHALGLATQLGSQFSLLYLYFDWDSSVSREHRAEILRFSSVVGSEIRFTAMSYQDLFVRVLRSEPRADAGYLSYLSGRYFPDLLKIKGN